MTEINLPLVSIALAAYNGQKYIEKQLISLVNQDYKNLEIVISDDCSTDGTWDILESYAKKDSRIRLLPRDFNRGYVNNFIRVFGECRGELISPSDQDDIWYPEKTRRLVECLGDAMLVYSNNRFVDENGDSLGKTLFDVLKGKMIQGSDPRNLLFCTSICGHAMLFRRILLRAENDLNTAPYIDWAIAFIAAKEGGIKYLDEVLVDWRQHDHSISAHLREKKPAGRKKILKTEGLNLNAFSAFKGEHQEFSLNAQKSWSAWRNSYVDFSMFIFVLRHKKITHKFYLTRFPEIKYVLGYKLKKLIRPNYYE